MDKFLEKKASQAVVDNSSSNNMATMSSSSSSSNSSSGSCSSSSGGNILSALRQAASIATSKSDAWGPYVQSNNSSAFSSSAGTLLKMNTYSLSDINGANREAAYKRQSSNTGWKIVNGVKIYSTFRNGGKVQGEGAEGFKLAMGDKGKCKNEKKSGKQNDTSDPPVTKKRKIQGEHSIGNDGSEKRGKQSTIYNTHNNHDLQQTTIQNQPPSNSTSSNIYHNTTTTTTTTTDLYGFSFD